MTRGSRIPPGLLASRSQADRRRQRAGLRLRDFTITNKTRARYEAAVARLLPYLEAQPSLHRLDEVVSDWIEWQWARGESLGIIADSLSGLHFFWPEVKGTLREAWRLFKSWRRVETPARAPPLTVELCRAFVAKAVADGDVLLATMVALGFHGLLRTGELLELRFRDVEFNLDCGVLSLRHSKSGRRTGAQEAIAIRDSLTLQLLDTLVYLRSPCPGELLWPRSAQTFREAFKRLCQCFRVESLAFKPYSLRRGGATWLLQAGVPLETILVRGRWRSLAVARLYLEDGLAQIPRLRTSVTNQKAISKWADKTPPTAFQP